MSNKKKKGRKKETKRHHFLIWFLLFAIAFLLGTIVYLSLDWANTIRDLQLQKGTQEVESYLQEAKEPTKPIANSKPVAKPTPKPVVQPTVKPKPVTPKVQPPKPQPQPQPQAKPPVKPQAKPKKGTLFLVLDDCGLSVKQVEKFLNIPIEMTYAIIPFLTESTEVAERVHREGREIIIHQPMQPLGNQDPGENAIFTTDENDVIINKLRASFINVPHAVGMNNHMGSKATMDRRVMKEVLWFIGHRGLFFFDSKTSGQVVGKEIAASLNTKYLQRNAMFLDNEKNEKAIREALKAGLKTADREGYAVMIGHCLTNELATVLLQMYPDILNQGYQFDRLSHYFTGDYDK